MFQQMIIPVNYKNTKILWDKRRTDPRHWNSLSGSDPSVLWSCKDTKSSTWRLYLGSNCRRCDRNRRYKTSWNGYWRCEELLEVNNLALEGKPEDMVIMAPTSANYHSTFFTSGPYDSVTDYVFRRKCGCIIPWIWWCKIRWIQLRLQGISG